MGTAHEGARTRETTSENKRVTNPPGRGRFPRLRGAVGAAHAGTQTRETTSAGTTQKPIVDVPTVWSVRCAKVRNVRFLDFVVVVSHGFVVNAGRVVPKKSVVAVSRVRAPSWALPA